MVSVEEDVEYWSIGQQCQFSIFFLPKLWYAQSYFRLRMYYLRERAGLRVSPEARVSNLKSLKKCSGRYQKWITEEQDSIIELAEMMLTYYAQSSSISQNHSTNLS